MYSYGHKYNPSDKKNSYMKCSPDEGGGFPTTMAAMQSSGVSSVAHAKAPPLTALHWSHLALSCWPTAHHFTLWESSKPRMHKMIQGPKESPRWLQTRCPAGHHWWQRLGATQSLLQLLASWLSTSGDQGVHKEQCWWSSSLPPDITSPGKLLSSPFQSWPFWNFLGLPSREQPMAIMCSALMVSW